MNIEFQQRLYNSIQYYEAIGAWGMAEALRKILIKMMEEE